MRILDEYSCFTTKTLEPPHVPSLSAESSCLPFNLTRARRPCQGAKCSTLDSLIRDFTPDGTEAQEQMFHSRVLIHEEERRSSPVIANTGTILIGPKLPKALQLSSYTSLLDTSNPEHVRTELRQLSISQESIESHQD